MNQRKRFTRIAAAGITFQAGSAAVDSATIMSALVFQLTSSSIAVGAVPAILRFGWLFPQFFVGFFAGRSGSTLRYYMIGAFGRTAAIALLSLTLVLGARWGGLGAAVLVLWTVYAFISGIVAVPYNDIVARSVPSQLRSRLLATRFFGGGVLALGVAVLFDRLITNLEFPTSYAAIFAVAAVLMLMSSVVFTILGEPEQTGPNKQPVGFVEYFRRGIQVFRQNRIFRRFVYAQWSGGAVLMAAPFYVVAVAEAGVSLQNVALLLGAQTAGALISNLLWGWWGDRLGKLSLLRGLAALRLLPPMMMIAIAVLMLLQPALPVFMITFFLLGALTNGLTIAVIGFLMEISPDDERPAYSGYFNAITAPAFLLPLAAGGVVQVFGTTPVFVFSLLAAVMQTVFVHNIGRSANKPINSKGSR